MTKAYSYIRFSTPEQEKGDSLRRQEDKALRYAKENGLELDTELNLKDLGLSGYKGDNLQGALGRFLDLVVEKKIPVGSYLLVENIDRLSRQSPWKAIDIVKVIIDEGINLVTLEGKPKLYSKESIEENTEQLQILLGSMIRAHGESKRKSELISETWNNKRNQIQKGIKLTKRIPYWLELSKDRKKFKRRIAVCNSIKRIYELKADGMGKSKIAQTLNMDENAWKPPKKVRKNRHGEIVGSTVGWRESYIQKILTNRAVIGEFQPHTLVNGKRTPTENVIPDYYPKVIPETLFYRVQDLMKINSDSNGGGKTGKANNLFAGIVYCGICGSKMHYINKGNTFKGGQYLQCDSARRKAEVTIITKAVKTRKNKKGKTSIATGVGISLRKEYGMPYKEDHVETFVCSAHSIPYNEFEERFFKDFEDLDATKVLPSTSEQDSKIKELLELESSYSLQSKKLEENIHNTIKAAGNTPDEENQKLYDKELTKLRVEKNEIDQKLIETQKNYRELKLVKQQFKTSVESTMEVYNFYKSLTDEKQQIEFRLKLRAEIKRLIEEIKIYPLTEPYQKEKELESGIIQIMDSKYIDHIRVNYRNSKQGYFIRPKNEIDPHAY